MFQVNSFCSPIFKRLFSNHIKKSSSFFCYFIYIFILLIWHLIKYCLQENDNMDFSKYWHPKLIVQNVISTSKDNVWKKLEFGKNGEAFIVEKRRIKGIFTENLELQDFPFDLQVLLYMYNVVRKNTSPRCLRNKTCFLTENLLHKMTKINDT